MVHENINELVDGFRYDAHPMGMLMSTVAALSTFYPEAKNIHDPEVRRRQIFRLIAKMPTLAAFAYRHSEGTPFVIPDNDLSYAGNFLQMMFRMTEREYKVDPVLEKALEVLFILHADHEQNCSTAAMRAVGSSEVDPYSAIAAAIAALYGPLHGGANEMVLRMLKEIGSKDKIPQFIKEVKTSGGEVRLMGFGHRVYKNFDPRAKIIKRMADQVFEVTGRNPLLDIALELERIALEDEYFVKRKLYPNVDFYSGLIYQSMGFPVDMFPVLFAIPRTAGWLAQWEEMLEDKDQKIARPRQIYLGSAEARLRAPRQAGLTPQREPRAGRCWKFVPDDSAADSLELADGDAGGDLGGGGATTRSDEGDRRSTLRRARSATGSARSGRRCGELPVGVGGAVQHEPLPHDLAVGVRLQPQLRVERAQPMCSLRRL